jgi:hypothetical protein
MGRGVDPLCLELGDGPEHRLLNWAGKRRRRLDDLISLEPDRLEHRIKREVKGAGMETFQVLEDKKLIEKVSEGGTYRYRVLEFCPGPPDCSGGLSAAGGASVESVGTMREARRTGTSGTSRVNTTSFTRATLSKPGGMERSVQKRDRAIIALAKDFFPRMVTGIQANEAMFKYEALINHLSQWQDQGVDRRTMKLMMVEFSQHPDWCRVSGKPPWQVFVGRRDQLASLVASRQRNDPANRRWSGGGDAYWLGHTSRVNYAT